MARGIGIEICDQRVRVAVVDTGAKRMRLVSFVEHIIQPSEKTPLDQATVEAIQKAVTQAKAKSGHSVASLDSGDAIVRELTLPFKAEDQVKKTYTFELESLIHNYSIDELVCDYFTVAQADKSTTLLAAAVPRQIVEDRLKLLQKAGVDPAQLDLDVSALFNAIVHVGAVESDDPFLIVYGTARFTKILLVENRRPRSIRTIRFSFPTPHAAELEQEERKVHREWQTSVLDKPAPIVILSASDSAKFADLDLEQRASLMEILAKEISRFLLANASAAAPSHILLAGEYEIEEAAQMLEAGTQLPVKRLGILDRLDHACQEEQAQTTALRAPVAIGLALKACGVDELGLDFRRSEFSYAKKYETIKTTALMTLELVIVFLAVIAFYFHRIYQDHAYAYRSGIFEDPEKHAMMELHQALYENVTGKKLDDPELAYSQLTEEYKQLAAQYGGGDHPIEHSALALANRVYVALDAAKTGGKLGDKDFYCLVQTLDVRQTTQASNESIQIDLSGVIQNQAYSEVLQNKLQSTEPFSDKQWAIQPGATQPTKDGMVMFSLKIIKAKQR